MTELACRRCTVAVLACVLFSVWCHCAVCAQCSEQAGSRQQAAGAGAGLSGQCRAQWSVAGRFSRASQWMGDGVVDVWLTGDW